MMDEYDELILLDDDDMRNARGVRDNRSRTGSRVGLIRSPRAVPVRRHPIGGFGGRDQRTPSAPVVVTPMVEEKRSILGNLSTGELVEIAAQVLSAIQPLPGAPVATGTHATDTSNLITYQTALAAHAKRVEQVRTLGSVLGKLLD
jgi:hypothetical protein